MTLFRNCKFQA